MTRRAGMDPALHKRYREAVAAIEMVRYPITVRSLARRLGMAESAVAQHLHRYPGFAHQLGVVSFDKGRRIIFRRNLLRLVVWLERKNAKITLLRTAKMLRVSYATLGRYLDDEPDLFRLIKPNLASKLGVRSRRTKR